RAGGALALGGAALVRCRRRQLRRLPRGRGGVGDFFAHSERADGSPRPVGPHAGEAMKKWWQEEHLAENWRPPHLLPTAALLGGAAAFATGGCAILQMRD